MDQVDPPLTSVAYPGIEVGQAAGALALQLIARTDRPVPGAVFQPTIVVRESTAPPSHAPRHNSLTRAIWAGDQLGRIEPANDHDGMAHRARYRVSAPTPTQPDHADHGSDRRVGRAAASLLQQRVNHAPGFGPRRDPCTRLADTHRYRTEPDGRSVTKPQIRRHHTDGRPDWAGRRRTPRSCACYRKPPPGQRGRGLLVLRTGV